MMEKYIDMFGSFMQPFIYHFVSEIIQNRPINRKPLVADRSVSVPVTLNDLERWAWGVKIFWQISVIMIVQFDLEWPNLA